MARREPQRSHDMSLRPALLLVDVQHDFLARDGLVPDPDDLVRAIARLVTGFRRFHLPVIHVQTRIKADGTGRMPHWEDLGVMECVEGTPGAEAPPALQPQRAEPVFVKPFFGAFGSPGLGRALQDARVNAVVVAGLYLHGCVRATVLEAYERGFQVWVADDAVGSTDPMHAELSRAWLDGRAAAFLPASALLELLGTVVPAAPPECMQPSACIGGQWVQGVSPFHSHVNPARPREVVAVRGTAEPALVSRVAEAAHQAGGWWSRSTPAERETLLRRWEMEVKASASVLVETLVLELGKPAREAREEVARALSHIRAAMQWVDPDITLAEGVRVAHHPRGCCALITPWNNPIAIPAAKIAAALALGNTVVWKPAPLATLGSQLLMETLLRAGLSGAAVSLISGGPDTARALIANPRVAAVSITGSIATGRAAAALCARFGKPIQAELGGNNAFVILADADLDVVSGSLAEAAFSFAGQRCTAIRRFIVERTVVAEFEERLRAAALSMQMGDPGSEATRIGPLVTASRLEEVDHAVQAAIHAGARRVCGGQRAMGFDAGHWYEPTLLTDVRPDSAIVQRETFGPVALIQVADSLEDAVALANGVPHGLVAGLLTRSDDAMDHFSGHAEAGVLRYGAGALAVHPQAPFGGWKASGLGPPEHGRWDVEFYSRVQAVYGGRRLPATDVDAAPALWSTAR